MRETHRSNNPPSTTILVVGGGVIGLSSALHMAAEFPQLRIIVCDAPTQPAAASRASAGMLAPYAEFEAQSRMFQLSSQSYDYFPAFLKNFQLDARLVECGILIPVSEVNAKAAEENARIAAGHVTIKWLDKAAVHAAEPALADGKCTRALQIPGGVINPRHLHDAMIRRAESQRIELRSETVVAFEKENGRIVSAKLQGGERITCDHVLLASGAWSRSLGELAGIELSMTPVKGQVACVAAPDSFLRHIIHAPDMYLAPRAGEGVIVGATSEEKGFDESVSNEVSAQLIAIAAAYAPALRNFPIADSWCGFRPKLSNEEPLIDWQGENLLVATGHFRNGILLAPITGRMIADLLRQKLTP